MIIIFYTHLGGIENIDIVHKEGNFFRNIAVITIGIGGLSSLVFHLAINTPDISTIKVINLSI